MFDRSSDAVGRDAHERRPRADPRGREIADRLEHAVGIVEHAQPFRRLDEGSEPRPRRLFRFEEEPAFVDVDRHTGRADDRAGRVVHRFAAPFEPVHASVGPDDAVIEAPRDVLASSRC